ncbi:hypothetical protein ACOME3_005110 [Neoechinorhynchus agilis]
MGACVSNKQKQRRTRIMKYDRNEQHHNHYPSNSNNVQNSFSYINTKPTPGVDMVVNGNVHHSRLIHSASSDCSQNARPFKRTNAVNNNGLAHHLYGNNRGKLYIALYDYEARTAEDLNVRKGDTLEILDGPDDYPWWYVMSRTTGAKGYVPANFIAEVESLEAEPWYFAEVRRLDAERLLLHPANDIGAFLIRDSESRKTHYSLSVRDTLEVKHYRIRHSPEEGCFFIARRVTFKTLHDLVDYYSRTAEGLCVELRRPCARTAVPTTEGLSYNTVDKWEIDRKCIKLTHKLGHGHFGDVYEGVWCGSVQVAVKMLIHGSMNRSDFLAEAQIMKKLRHPKLIQLFAVCTLEEPIYIVTELMRNGSLQHYLQTSEGKRTTMPTLIDMAAQVATGMAYLESQNYIHRDLAARNILVNDNLEVKIADFGLARILQDHQEGIYDARQGTRFPIKWTAPEGALYNKFTIKSDVWSFGILLVELVTYGRDPYPGLNNNEVLKRVQNGYRIPCPVTCPRQLYAIMLECWRKAPEDRPAFETLQWRLEEFYSLDKLQYDGDSPN